MNIDLECITLLSEVIPRYCAWLGERGYNIADDGITIVREWDGWVLTVHTTAADGEHVVFEWTADFVAEQAADDAN